MARTFVIVGKSIAFVTDQERRFLELKETLGSHDAVLRVAVLIPAGITDPGSSKHRIKRVLGEDMFDVGYE